MKGMATFGDYYGKGMATYVDYFIPRFVARRPPIFLELEARKYDLDDDWECSLPYF